jgi:ribonuclease VapC
VNTGEEPSDRGPVLDASALLAYLGNEPGAERVADAIAGRAVMSTVNLAEVLSTAAARGADPQQLARELTARGLIDGALSIEALTTDDAVEVARLRPITRAAGLSLADRACLALARRLAALVLTADSAWTGLDLGVVIELVR